MTTTIVNFRPSQALYVIERRRRIETHIATRLVNSLLARFKVKLTHLRQHHEPWMRFTVPMVAEGGLMRFDRAAVKRRMMKMLAEQSWQVLNDSDDPEYSFFIVVTRRHR